MNNEHNKNLMFKVAGVLLLLVIALVVMVFGPEPQQPVNPAQALDTTIEGEYICLPHRDTSGPQTLECALGISATDGHNYSLDFSQVLYSHDINFPMGSQLVIKGTIVPVEVLSTDHWRQYDMRGIIRVSEIKVK